MAESLLFTKGADRKTIYGEIFPQIELMVDAEDDLIANLANVAAVLKTAFDFFWVGFYLTGESDLVLGPFQGPIACTRIGFNKGVCGHAFTTEATVIVEDVEAFPGHIACASDSKSEIVVPLKRKTGEVWGVLDVDSDRLADFDETDAAWLEKIAATLSL
ncbi:MAG: GAF domain-containing protein [Pyrinomonadaceae bacterium]